MQLLSRPFRTALMLTVVLLPATLGCEEKEEVTSILFFPEVRLGAAPAQGIFYL